MGEIAVSEKYAVKKKTVCITEQQELLMIKGYKEMSRINSEFAESAVQTDNEALELGEQKLAECE